MRMIHGVVAMKKIVFVCSDERLPLIRGEWNLKAYEMIRAYSHSLTRYETKEDKQTYNRMYALLGFYSLTEIAKENGFCHVVQRQTMSISIFGVILNPY